MISVILSGGSHGGETAEFDETSSPSRVRFPLRLGRVEVYELRDVLDEFGLPIGEKVGLYVGVEAG